MALNDSHCHFFSPHFFATLGRGLKENDAILPAERVIERLGWDDPETPERLADRWVAELDRHGLGAPLSSPACLVMRRRSRPRSSVIRRVLSDSSWSTRPNPKRRSRPRRLSIETVYERSACFRRCTASHFKTTESVASSRWRRPDPERRSSFIVECCRSACARS